MEKYDLTVIGAGASGLTAALSAKRNHPGIKIALFEQLPKAGKKILATGNGRCNLTNLNAAPPDYNNSSFASGALTQYPPEKVIGFFESIGLMTYADDEGRVYPRSNNASSVLDALRYSVDNSDIHLFTDCKINSIRKESNGFILNESFFANKCIIASGGKSSPVQGSDGSGYLLARSLGHSVTPLFPSLTPLNVSQNEIKTLKGIRAVNVRLRLLCETGEFESCGEILFTQTGISGIAAMELAAAANKSIFNGVNPRLIIDFLPEISENTLTEITERLLSADNRPADSLLTGLLPKAVGISVLKKSGFYSIESIKSDLKTASAAISKTIKNCTFEISGTKGFNDSQVTSGGINTDEINPETLQSRLMNNLYFSGEIIDIDSRCGGYNLQWAFASGLLAGELNDQD